MYSYLTSPGDKGFDSDCYWNLANDPRYTSHRWDIAQLMELVLLVVVSKNTYEAHYIWRSS